MTHSDKRLPTPVASESRTRDIHDRVDVERRKRKKELEILLRVHCEYVCDGPTLSSPKDNTDREARRCSTLMRMVHHRIIIEINRGKNLANSPRVRTEH